jgi:NADH-quinone oxidoreductase subunit L
LAGLIAVQQNDIKRILAYSTLSQLGFMVMGVGLHGPGESMFHLTTHAFFKALLFLGAGSVILALHHEQNIWKMGGLRKKLGTTWWTFLVGTLAIAGVVPFSGFYSKDAILARALEQHAYGRLAVGGLVAILTTFYMFRLYFVVFETSSRTDAAGHAQESPPVMVIPLRVLAVLSFIAGFIGLENLLARQPFASAEQPVHIMSLGQQLLAPFTHAPVAAALGLFAVAVGFAGAYVFYSKSSADPLPARLGSLSRWMENRFYLDELYQATFIRFHDFIAAIAGWIDRWLIAGVGVQGVHGTTELLGRALRQFQTGNLQSYALLFALGVALVLIFMLR